MEITKKFYAKNRAAWRKWLEKNAEAKKEIWLVFDKKSHNQDRLTYQEALEEALCFGWIDGQAKGIDGKQYAQRFTHRSSKSSWSLININNYKRLLKARLVSEYGKKIFNQKHRVYDPKAESPLYAIWKVFEKAANPAKAKMLMRFFKTGKGEYAAALSATGPTGGGVQLGAVAANQFLYATWHVFTVGTTMTIQVESDDNGGFSSPTARGTIGPVTLRGGTWMTRVAGPITDTFYRFNVTANTGSHIVAGAIGIGS